jgi:hypothetical protein
MAKKVVAVLQKKGGRVVARCIKMVRSEKTGAYIFREEMVNVEREKEFFAD